VAELAIERLTDRVVATFLGRHPGANEPRRIVPHVLSMTALALANPVTFIVEMKTCDVEQHGPVPGVMGRCAGGVGCVAFLRPASPNHESLGATGEPLASACICSACALMIASVDASVSKTE